MDFGYSLLVRGGSSVLWVFMNLRYLLTYRDSALGNGSRTQLSRSTGICSSLLC